MALGSESNLLSITLKSIPKKIRSSRLDLIYKCTVIMYHSSLLLWL